MNTAKETDKLPCAFLLKTRFNELDNFHSKYQVNVSENVYNL